ncbi:MAG: hypothetical protein HYU55_00360 [Nocardioides sp.]|nr:hypothetical protein [Nocardioides sp.]
MKKLLAVLVGGLMMAAGLVAVSTTTSSAAPYPGTVATNCNVNVRHATTRSGTRIAVWVTAAGNGQPKGRVTVNVDRRKGGDSASDSGWFNGGRTIMKMGRLRPGVYDGNFHFNSRPAKSVFKNCSESFAFRVTRR